MNNNPFESSSPYQRFPDITGSPPNDSSFTQWLHGSTGAQQQQQPFQQIPPFSGFVPQQDASFQPFGQYVASQLPLNGSGYGPIQGMAAPVSTGYNLQSPGVAQFDPYGSIGQGTPQQQQQQQQPSNVSQTPTSPGVATSASGQLHPREYIRVHKSEVESWNAYTWKQLLNTFDALKDAWEARKKEIHGHIAQLRLQYGGYYAGQMEVSRLQAMAKDAESNHDSVAASSFQMHEVFTSYRQSADAASKLRVREAANAAIHGLPDWPPLAY